jgi:putative Holliday junction resolvase
MMEMPQNSESSRDFGGAPKRWLAVDIGDVRTGVAISDEGAILATPIGTVVARTKELLCAEAQTFLENFIASNLDIPSISMLTGESPQLKRREHDEGRLDVCDLFAGIVVGLPLNQSGGESARAAKVREWGDLLADSLGLAAHFVDERYTTRRMIAADRAIGRRAADGRANIDARAAAEILQSFLDAKRLKSRTDE